MAKRWLIGTLTTSVLLWLAATGLQGAKPSSALPLKVDFRSATTDGLYGDGDGLYIDGADNVRAVLLDNDFGNFVFDTNDNAGLHLHRRLVLDFHDQPGLPSSIPSNGAYSVDVFLGTLGVTGVPAVDGDGLLRFHCDFGNPSCKQWTMTPTPVEGQADGQAGLYSISSGKKPTETYLGSYTMPFSATLTPQ